MAAKRFDIIIRQSQREEDSKSPRQQIAECERVCERNEYEIGRVHDSGRSESGGTMARASVEAAAQRVRAGEVDGVMVAWLSRFSRAPIEEAMAVYRQIVKAGGVFVATDTNGGIPVDPHDPQSETMFVIQLQFAHQQWKEIQHRMNLNRKGAVEEGKCLSLKWGYRFKDTARRKDKRGLDRGLMDSHLEPVPELVPIVKELFKRAAGGSTWLELARYLDSADPLPDGRKWTRQTVVGIIRSRTYRGEVISGEFVNRAAHDWIVDEITWKRAQRPRGRRTPRGTYLLSGLARCSSCGHTLHGRSLGAYRGAKRVYRCCNPSCSKRLSVMTNRLDDEAVAQLGEHVQNAQLVTVGNGADEVQLRAEVERLGAEVERLAMITPRHARAIQAHQDALEAAEQALETAEEALAQASGDEPEVPDLSEVPELALAEWRQIVAAGIKEIEVRPSTGPGASSNIPARIDVEFHQDATRRVAEAYARILGSHDGQLWVAA